MLGYVLDILNRDLTHHALLFGLIIILLAGKVAHEIGQDGNA